MILVIEDETSVRKNIVDLLTAEGFEAIGAENGVVGVELAQHELPDLIICDILMPKLDGYGVLMALQESSATRPIPFIFLSAKTDRQDLRHGMTLGADDYLTKPFTRAELLEAIATRLKKHSTLVQLQHKVEELEQSHVLKDDFVGAVIHDLRSPLTNMMIAIEMLKSDPDVSMHPSYLNILQTECGREIELINDLLDLQRLESQLQPQDLESIPLSSWLTSVIEPFRIRAQVRKQAFQFAPLPPNQTIRSHRLSLERMLGELLSNACKYTPPGGYIRLSVVSKPIATATLVPVNALALTTLSPSHVLTFQVGNTAEIPTDSLPHLFEKFYRVPNGDPWHQGGTGLGLTLVQKVSERLGGWIDVTSADQWTQFSLQIPVQLTSISPVDSISSVD